MPNRSSKPKRPRDPNQLAKLLTDIATGGAVDVSTTPTKDPSAVELGRKGGLKGGVARQKALSKERRKEIAEKAAKERWRKS